MIISNFVAYAKQAWKNKPDTSTPLSAARLTHLEDGVKGNSDAIEKIAAAVVSQIVNDPNKIPSMAALFSVNDKVDSVISDLGGKADINKLPQMVHTSITGTGSDYYDINCPGVKYGATVIAQFSSQRNEYYILNADAISDNKVRIRINKPVPVDIGIYVNVVYSVN